MIDIRIPNKGSLVLPPDLILSITAKSPMYFGGDISVMPGGYSLAFSVDADLNRAQLGYVHFPNKKDPATSLAVQVHLDGNFYAHGLLTVKQTSAKSYKLQLFFGASQYRHLQVQSLRDYDHGPLDSVTTSPAGWQAYAESFFPMFTDYQFFPIDYGSYREAGGTYIHYLMRLIWEAEGLQVIDGVFVSEMKRLLILGDKNYNVEVVSGSPTAVDKADWVPHMAVAHFLKECVKNFGFAYLFYPNSKKVKLLYFNDVLAATPEDLRERQRIPAELDHEDYAEIKTIGWEQNSGISTFGTHALDDDGDEILGRLTSSTDHSVFDGHADRAAPRIDSDLTLGAVDTSTFKEDGRVLFARNSYVDTDFKLYVYTTHDIIGPPDLPNVVGDIRLAWDGTEHGLYDKFWKRWLDFLRNTKAHTVPMHLTWADLYNHHLLFQKPVLVADEVGGSVMRCIFPEIKFRIHNTKGLLPAEQTLLQIR